MRYLYTFKYIFLVSVPCLYLSLMSHKTNALKDLYCGHLGYDYGVRLLTLQNSILLLPSRGYK